MSAAQNRRLPKLIITILIIFVLAASLIMAIANRNAPTSERVNLSDYYKAEDGSAAIIVNGTLSNVRAVIKNSQPYVKLGLVTGEINPGFYFEVSSGRLLYTNATEVVSATADQSNNGAAIFYDSAEPSSELSWEDRIMVQLPYVAKYTDIDVDYYTNPARVFIRSRFGECMAAKGVSGACIRTGPSGSSRVLAELDGEEDLWLISEENGWAQVYAAGSAGVAGYLTSEELTDIHSVTEEGPYREPEYTHILKDDDICLVWHQVFSDSGVDSLENLLSRTSGANVLSPTWFSVTDSDGTISSRANSDYVSIAHQHGMQIWALVENFNTENKLDYSVLLGTENARSHMISSLINEAEQYDLDGINVDFEGLPSEAGAGYIQFIRELSIACRRQGLVLSVDCYVPSAWTAHYHRDLLAQTVDYIIVMAYDEHYDGSDAGSTSSLSFVKDGIENTIAAGVPAERLIPAIPFYSRLWKGEGVTLKSSTINMNDMKERFNSAEEGAVWDDTLGQYFIETTEDGVLTRLWVEDGRSLSAKLGVIGNYDVAGIACWKLGMENSEAWEAINTYLER